MALRSEDVRVGDQLVYRGRAGGPVVGTVKGIERSRHGTPDLVLFTFAGEGGLQLIMRLSELVRDSARLSEADLSIRG
jgi:hypothetical protein